MALRLLAGIEPVKVEWSDTRTAAHVGVPEEAAYAYRFGFTTNSGVPGFAVPTPVNTTNSVEINTAVPLRGSVRVNVRYTRRLNEDENRAGQDTLLSISRRRALESTFPSLDLSINNLQKLRIFGSKLQSSTLSLGFDRTTSEGFLRNFDYRGVQRGADANRRDAEAMNFNANWNGQWKGGLTTTLTATQNSSQENSPGQRREGTRRQVQGNLRFRVAPEGGLKLPLFGMLKTGMDVLINGSYSADSGKLFNDPNNPERFIQERETHTIGFGVNSNYTLSRSINGGLELGYNRSRNDRHNQTITTLRLGVNLTFQF